jgi:hypothetical protein
MQTRAAIAPSVLCVVALTCGCDGSSETPKPGASGGSSGMAAYGGASSQGGTGGTAGGGPSCWRPFNDQSPWNTPISGTAALDPDSATLVTDFSSIAGQTEFWINIQDYSIPVYGVASAATPMVTVSASLGGTGFRTGAASDSVTAGSGLAPIPSGATPAAGSDRHLAIVDRAANLEWGFWDANQSSTGWTAGEASTMDLAGSGVRPPERNAPWWAGHGPRACGFSLIAGLITADELRCGAIEHALVVAYPHIRSRYYTPPASTAQGTTSDALPARGIPCGGHIQLDPSLDVTTLGLTPTGLLIARALQKYGAFVGDYSGAVSLYADASADAQAYWGGGVLGNGDAQGIPLGRFRLLELGTTYDNGN